MSAQSLEVFWFYKTATCNGKPPDLNDVNKVHLAFGWQGADNKWVGFNAAHPLQPIEVIGDYTNIAVGSDNVFHALWTDTNNVQNFVWVGGLEFVPTPSHNQDVVTASGSF